MSRHLSAGQAVLGALIALALLCITTTGFWAMQHRQQKANFQRSANTRIQLQAMKQTLLNFATRQGINTLTQAGHLPCPAQTPDGEPLVVCTQKRVGYWPSKSVIKTNYLGSALGQIAPPPSTRQTLQWHYGVSSQLVQPNPLGWSQWVNFDLPALTVHAPEGTYSEISAVVATDIQIAGPDIWTVQPPYLLISKAELLAAINNVVREQTLFTLQRWTHFQKGTSQNTPWSPQAHENLTRSGSPNEWIPQNSGCQCHCTKTRCTCRCSQQAHWVSSQTCVGSTGCTGSRPEHNGSTLYHCTSTTESACQFKGPAGLDSQWPVSRFMPEAGMNRPCNPGSKPWCPTSPGGEACDCAFDWPATVLGQIDHIRIFRGEQGWTSTVTQP